MPEIISENTNFHLTKKSSIVDFNFTLFLFLTDCECFGGSLHCDVKCACEDSLNRPENKVAVLGAQYQNES